jgi:gluconokinase
MARGDIAPFAMTRPDSHHENSEYRFEDKAVVIVVMGVSGCGKSTIGRALADAFGWDFQEGDSLHPQANIEKMTGGISLNDDDRWPWLDRIAAWISDETTQRHNGVVTCSSLKRSYRDRLRQAGIGVRFVYIHVSRAELERRTQQREHFMPASLLDSQLKTLQEPTADELALTVSGEATIETMIADVRHWLAESASSA